MTFDEFERRAKEVFESIPADFKEGVDGLLVERKPSPHPTLPDIFTLGECRTEQYPGDFGGPGQIRSFVVLYYGSFRQLSRRSEDWDWEEELWETITHEIKHHLESLALEDALEVEDYAVDQNFARREGEPFDAFFYRHGELTGADRFEVDGDVFVEVPVGQDELVLGQFSIQLGDDRLELALPEPLGDVHYLTLEGLKGDDGDSNGDTIAVLVKRRTVLDSLRAALRGGALDVRHSAIRVAGR